MPSTTALNLLAARSSRVLPISLQLAAAPSTRPIAAEALCEEVNCWVGGVVVPMPAPLARMKPARGRTRKDAIAITQELCPKRNKRRSPGFPRDGAAVARARQCYDPR